ncbi:hypothetical protein Rfer_3958 [Rhodoferax ferrireducens T118]|uniref:Lipoprotein n=2 Tax=Rhodoferax ferrireducens TaxID=192843 RepID=Q21RE6_ALBFT|nr:hypothetical protein Rfer_3958 [Rhodoferax ferrireducens T118]
MNNQVLTRRATLITLTSAVGLLAACANGYRYRDRSGRYVPVPVANFKLQRASVRWQDNPGFFVSIGVVAYGGVSSAAMREATKPTSPQARQATSDMNLIRNLFKEELSATLKDRLKNSGVEEGVDQLIVVTPVSGHQTGAETVMSLRTVVLDMASKEKWQYDVGVTSGPLVLGPQNNKPTNQYVHDYVSTIISVFKDGRLID